MNTAALVARIHAKAREQFDPAAADALMWAADEIETYSKAWELEELTLRQAAVESDYSTDHLGRLLAEGSIENVGRPHAPRVRRRDLPKKPKPAKQKADDDGPPVAAEVLESRGLPDFLTDDL